MSGVASIWRPAFRAMRNRCACQRNASVVGVEISPYVDGDDRPQHGPSSRRGISSYVVLLPEVPPDSPETNAIMRLDSLPAFSEITPIDCVNGVAKLSIEFETELTLHSERLTQTPNTFESVILWRAWAMFWLLKWENMADVWIFHLASFIATNGRMYSR